MTKTISRLAVLSLAAFPIPAFAVPAFVSDGQVLTSSIFVDDAYVAGGNVTINHPVQGDLKIVGGNVTVNGNVSGSVYAGGGNVTINGSVGNDAYLIGGTVQITGKVADDLFVAGGNLDAGRAAEVGGSAFIGSGNVLWMGTVKEAMTIESQSITFGGRVLGDLEMRAEGVVTVLPDAWVEGDGRFISSHEPTFDSGFVKGKFSYARNEEVSSSQLDEATSLFSGVWLLFSFTNLVSSMALGIILVFLFPNLLHRTGEVATTRPFVSLWEGFLVMVALTALTFLGFVTVLGIKLAIILLAYLSTLTTVVGTLNGYLVAHWLMRRQKETRWWTVGYLLAGSVIYAFASLVPYLGVVVWVGLSFVSIGAFYRAEGEAYRAMRTQEIL